MVSLLSESRCARASARAAIAGAGAIGIVCAGATRAVAHGFGQRYELPLPLGLYLFGAAAAVALSFVLFALFAARAPKMRPRAEIDLLANPVGRALSQSAVLVAVRAAALALFLVTVLAGLAGDQNPYRNLAPTLVWIVWWVGLAYVAAFLGDLWALINPWRTMLDAAQWLAQRVGRERALRPRLAYPRALGAWPACLLLLAFAWIELVYPHAASPRHIALLAIAYSALTLAGMLAFGRDTWLANGEVFALVFGTFGRFAPTEAREGRLLLRPFGSGLLQAGPVSTSMMAFVLLLLASVLYDGLIGTGEWAALAAAVRARWSWVGDDLLKSVGLPAFWLLFLAAYLGVCALMSRVAAGVPSPLAVARSFALTLVPIAIGYHVAHYLVFLLVQGQYIVPLLSDPLGRGWNLLGTAGYRVDIALAGARFAWYAALAAIVCGHVVAVYLAHRQATEVFAPRLALATQVPLTLLMVAYTFVGLSIMAEPITESRATPAAPAVVAREVAIPTDALLPQAGTGRLEPVGEGRTARLRLTYKVLGSAFHDGTKLTGADLLYAYAFAYRWGAREDGEHYDALVAAATAPMRQQLLGVRVTGVDAASKSFRVGDVSFVREVHAVEVYLAAPPEAPEWSATIAPPWSALPWHVLALMEEAVARGWAAFSAAEARRRGLPQLDLVRDATLSDKLAGLAARFEREGWVPEALRGQASAEEARRRWAALAAFRKANGHLLVTNGPYRLKSWTGESATLEAFRDLTYPLGVGSYDAYAVPRRGFITSAEWKGERLVLRGDIEVVETFQRSYRLVRTPIAELPATTLRRSAPACRYVVVGQDGRVRLAGSAAPAGDGSFAIDLAGRLAPGRYTLRAVIAVNGNAVNAAVHREQVVIPGPP